MRSTTREISCTIAIAFVLMITTGCKKENASSPVNGRVLTLSAIAGNLITGDWITNASEKSVIKSSADAIKISGDAAGYYYVYQKINTGEDKFYKATVTVDYTINNYFSAGLYILDSTLQHTLAKFERTNSSGSNETWEAVFYSKTPAQVAVALGFFNGINADVTFSNVALVEYQYQPEMGSSAFAAHLGEKFPLLFSADQFDSTINKISDYVNSVLLCRYAYYEDTVELPLLATMIGSDSNYAWFNSYLNSLDQIQIGYCQKSSLSLSEILNNEFHIPTKQVHMVFGPEGKHQFSEYWNPFAGKWIAIDPCFNTRYIKDDALVGVEDFDRSEAPQHMAYFGTHYYYPSNDYLIWFWQNMDNLMITDYYSISYPY